MTWLDYAVIGVLLVSMVLSAFRGVVREIFSLGGLIIALLAANLFAGPLSIHLPQAHLQVGSIVQWIFQAAIVRLDGEFPSAAVHQHGEFDFGGAAVFEQGVDSRADGAARVKHIVHQDHDGAFEILRQFCPAKVRGESGPAWIIPVKRDVQHASLNTGALLLQDLGQASCKGHATPVDAYQTEALLGMALQDFIGQAVDPGIDIAGGEELLAWGFHVLR